ncbi:MAG: 2OG-Fe(II) oxygenase [Steroidobacteraceae bacterium]|jgi:Rps23 Pro-64 3,4-dihydroxylase Tpa1-like proline 4-hydroxylase
MQHVDVQQDSNTSVTAAAANDPFVQSATLPVKFDGGLALDPAAARAFGEKFSSKYRLAQPFPHIVIDDFLPTDVIERVAKSFPEQALAHDKVMLDEFSHFRKRQIAPDECDPFARSFFQFLNSSAVLTFLEALTGIDGLISDPHFEGGGFHKVSQGGKLGVHADFRIHRKLHLVRRLNLLLYLNKDWDDNYGGALELWDKKMAASVCSIAPISNRCVIFNTDIDSFHGHPDPLNIPAGLHRKSVATYYYTASRSIYGEVADNDTKWMPRPTDSKKFKAVTAKYRVKIFLKDLCPPLAYRALMSLRRR